MTNPDAAHFNMVPLADLRAMAPRRPAGYVEDVLSLATSRDDLHVLLTREVYDALRAHYDPQPMTPPAAGAFDGSALWARLHAETSPTPAFLDQFTAAIPCGTCKAGWLAMLDRTPPDRSSVPAWRRWTVDRHNEVNAKLGKPLVTYSEAAARWNW